ncbi:MAG: hypothetical protein ACT4O3_01465 [Elusimicrobiota bacterium]|jgi:DNA polymerase III delta prime subunit
MTHGKKTTALALLAAGLAASGLGASLRAEARSTVDPDAYGYQEKGAFIQALETELGGIKRDINLLADSTRSPEARRTEDTREVMRDLQARKVTADQALEELKKARTRKKWDAEKRQMARAMEDLRQAHADAKDHYYGTGRIFQR